jgi:hypothetical protein
MADNDTATQYEWAAEDKKLQLADEFNEVRKIAAVREAEQVRLKRLEDSKRAPDYAFKSPEAKAQIDQSITFAQRNLERRNNELAQAVAATEKTQQEVDYNLGKASEARGGPPRTQTVPPPGPVATQQPNPTPLNATQQAAQPPIATPANPSPAPVTRTGSAIEQGGEAAARVEPRRSPPEDFVYDRDGNLLPADSSAAAERRAEIAAEENRARAFDAVDRSGSTQSEGNAGEAAARVEPRRSPPEDFVFEEDGSLIPSDSARAAERREEIAAEENRARAFDAVDRSGSAIEQGGEEGNLRLPPNVPPNTSAVWDVETSTWAVMDNDTGQILRSGFGTEEQAQASAENRNLDLSGSTQEDGDAGEAEARARVPEPVPPNLTAAYDPETESWGVFDNDKGVFIETGLTEEDAQRAAGDPFEAARLARESEEDLPTAFEPDPVPGNFTAVWDPATESWGVWNNDTGEFESTGLTEQEAQLRAEDLSTTGVAGERPTPTGSTGLTPEEQRAKEEAAAKANAINQATRQSVYKQAGSSDWRVRLQLAPTSNYLYNEGAGQRGILDPLFYTNGVIFPYTPAIQTTYQAKYADYDLVHSNFRGVFYQSSRVDDINLRATFTAQDTDEANYLLAVIHFFRSVTKMFYGKDDKLRGSPPPLVYLSGLGMDQFYGHPCLVRSFNYSLPDNVDYIRATNVNNYGTDLLTRRKASATSSVAGLGATGNRILNAGLEKFFPAAKPAPNTVVAQVNNTQLANYVPTKMEIDIVLIPVQTRSQVSKQFSLKNFANGNLIRNGFW